MKRKIAIAVVIVVILSAIVGIALSIESSLDSAIKAEESKPKTITLYDSHTGTMIQRWTNCAGDITVFQRGYCRYTDSRTGKTLEISEGGIVVVQEE